MHEYTYVSLNKYTVGVASSRSKSNGAFSITVVNITFPPAKSNDDQVTITSTK